jgi:3'(2'), 5'-bisphosphate nucleotidase
MIGILGCPNLSKDFSRPFDDPDPRGSLYTCIRGEGVYEQAADGSDARPVQLTRLRHNAGDPISVCTSVEESHTASEKVEAVLRAAAAKGLKTREPARLDSQCKYAVVARGQADAYIRLPTRKGYVERIWDHAAGALIAVEAGCAVTDALGHELDFSQGRGLEKNRGILVAPAQPHGVLLGAIQELGAAG